jgi:hypothetical protein
MQGMATMDNDCFKFYVSTRMQLQESTSVIYSDLKRIYGDNCPSRATIYRYASPPPPTPSSSSSGPGRPVSVSTPENLVLVDELIRDDRHLSVRQIENITGINRDAVHNILKQGLGRHHVCSTWIPHTLTPKNKELRVGCAKSIKSNLCNFANRNRLYAVQDETWIFFKPTLPKSRNKVWLAGDEKRPTVVRDTAMTTRKTLLSVIFTANKKFYVQATEKSETIDSEYFVNFLRSCGNKWCMLRSDPTHLSDLLLQFDNARPHVSSITKQFLSRRQVNTLWQAPYSPDLNLCDRWLFKWLKKEFQNTEFTGPQEVVTASLQVLRAIPESVYLREIEKLLDHCQMVIDNGGDYVTN